MLAKLLNLSRRWATRKTAPIRWNRPVLEELESRLMPSVSIYRIADRSSPDQPVNNETVLVIEMHGPGNNVRIDHHAGDLQVLALAGTRFERFEDFVGSQSNAIAGSYFHYADYGYNAIRIIAGTGGNNVEIDGNVYGLQYQGGANRSAPGNHLSLGNGSLQGIQAPITITDAYSTTAVDVNAQLDAAPQTAILGNSGQYGAITGLGAAEIDYQTAHIANLALFLGANTNVRVANTWTNTDIINSGAATITVGAGHTGGIQGVLNLWNTGGMDRIDVNDRADATPSAVTLDTGTGDGSRGTIAGLSPAAITFDTAHAAAVTLGLGTDRGNTLVVNGANDATNRTLALHAGIPFAYGSELFGVYGIIDGMTPAAIRYTGGGLSSVAVHTGTGVETVNVLNTGILSLRLPWVGNFLNIAMPPLVLVGHSAATMVNVGDQGSVRGILGSLTVTNTGSDGTTLNLDDSTDPLGHTVFLDTASHNLGSYGTVTGLSPGSIAYRIAAVNRLQVQTGTGTETMNVVSAPVGTTVVGHSSNTAVNIGNHGIVAGYPHDITVMGTFNRGIQLKVDDSADAWSRTVTLDRISYYDANHVKHTVDVVRGLTPGNIVYDPAAVGALELDTGTGVTIVNVLQIDVPTTLAGHSFNDTINVGAGLIGNIGISLTVSNTYAGRTQLNVDDSANPFRSTVTLAPGGLRIYARPRYLHYLPGPPLFIGWSPGTLLGLSVQTGTGGTLILDSDTVTATNFVGHATTGADVLLELGPANAWQRAGVGYGNLYGNVTFAGF